MSESEIPNWIPLAIGITSNLVVSNTFGKVFQLRYYLLISQRFSYFEPQWLLFSVLKYEITIKPPTFTVFSYSMYNY